MIKVGDTVRFKNGRLRYGHPLQVARKKQRLTKVTDLSKKWWDWRNRTWHQVALLDDGTAESVKALAFVRRH